MTSVRTSLLCAAALLGLAGCRVGLDVSDAAQITCARDADCPEGWRCNLNRQRCQRGDTNSVPVVTVRGATAAGRAGTVHGFEVEVSDADGAPAGSSAVDLDVSYSLDGVSACAATLVEPATGLEATAAGATHALAWDLLADSELGTTQPAACRLPVVELDLSGDGRPGEVVVAYTSGIRLGVTATDDGTPPRASVEAVGEPFAVGNLPPTLALALEGGPDVSLAVPFTVRAADPAADLVDVEVQFRLATDPAGTWRLPALSGATADLVSAPTLAAAPESLLVWHTDAPLGTAAQAGGVGLTNTGAVLRARAVDHALAGALTYGPWVEQAVNVVNQSPPVMGSLAISGGEAGAASSLAWLEYQVVDRQRDTVDVEVEWRHAGAATWRSATPYPSVQHSGRHGLATDAEATTTLHTFVWDVGADLPARAEAVQVRLRAADDTAASAWLVADVPFPAGIDAVGGFEAVHAEVQVLAAAANQHTPRLFTGDVDGDGDVDLVALTQTSGLRLWRSSAAGVLGAPTDVAIPSFRGAAATGDFDGDGALDVAVKSRDGDAQVALGGAAGLSVVAEPIPSPFGVSPRLAAGDFDGDGRDDLAVGGSTGIRIHRSDGDGTFTQDGAELAVGPVYALAAGDLDGDGADDLAYAVPTGPGTGDPSGTRYVPLALRVRRGQPGVAAGMLSPAVEEVASGLGRTVDSSTLHDVALGTGDLDGDGADELLAADIWFIGHVRARVLGRSGGWHELAQAESPGAALAIHWDAPGADPAAARLVLASPGQAVAWGYDPSARTLFAAAAPLAATSVDLAFADLDGDALPDALVSAETAGTGAVHVYRQSATAGIPAGAYAAAGATPVAEGARALTAGDLDGDGVADVLVGDAVRDSLRTVAPYLGGARAGVGTFTLAGAAAPTQLLPEGTNDQAASNSVLFADVTGDGALDALLAAEAGTYFVAVAAGPDDPFHFARGRLVPVAGVPGFGELLAADFDADGRDDPVFHESGSAWVSRSRGAAGAVDSFLTVQLTPAFFPGLFAAGDLSGDGVEDLVAAGGTSVAVWIATPGGGAPFAAPCTGAVAAAPSGLAVGDADGDGRGELVLSTAASVLSYGWTGACPLVLEKTSTTASGLRQLRLVDLNGDGALDAVGLSGAASPFTIGVHVGEQSQGKATGGFGPLSSTGVSLSREPWGAADANRDGVPELYGVEADVLHVYPGARWVDRPAWTASLPGGAVRATGAAPGLDRFGAARRLDLVLRPVVDRPARAASAGGARAELAGRMVRAGLAPLASGWAAVSKTWRLEGDWLSDVEVRAGERVVVPRSSLDGWGAGTLVDVALPLHGGLSAVDWNAPGAGARVVCRQVTGWALDGTGLPRTPDGRARFLPVEQWVEVPRDLDGDLATGAGARFTIGAGEVRLLAERLGTCQVFGRVP